MVAVMRRRRRACVRCVARLRGVCRCYVTGSRSPGAHHGAGVLLTFWTARAPGVVPDHGVWCGGPVAGVVATCRRLRCVQAVSWYVFP